MACNTIIQQGRFTADGSNEILRLRSDIDWIEVDNYTVINAATASYGAQFRWQRGMADDDAIINAFDGGGTAMVMSSAAAGGVSGFKLLDTSENSLSDSVVISAATNATQPVVSTGTTTGLATGSIVRLYTMTGQESLASYDFEIDTVVASTSFRIRYAMANAPGAACTGGTYRIVKWDPIYYPRWRYIANVTQANPAVVTTTVSHGFTVGQKIRFKIPSDFDMTELNDLSGTVTAVTASTITTDIDASGFTAFSFALPADVPFSPAIIAPLGEDVSEARSASVSELDDATRNISYLGVELGAGNTSPAGNNNDVIYWRAGKSFSVDNE